MGYSREDLEIQMEYLETDIRNTEFMLKELSIRRATAYGELSKVLNQLEEIDWEFVGVGERLYDED